MLSAEQQKTIENSLWVVNTVLKELGLQGDEDLRQDANMYLCRCLERFNDHSNAKWTTYAYKNIFMFVKRTKKRRNQKAMQTIDFTSFADNADDLVADKSQPFLFATLLAECTPVERKVIQMRRNGYKIYEIGEMLGCTPRFITKTLKEIYKRITKN